MRLPWKRHEPTGRPEPAPHKPSALTHAEAASCIERNPDMVVLDVRTFAEFRRGHIPGARSVPLAALSGRLDEIPRDRQILVVCLSGHRSARAAAMLLGAGHADVQHLAGGMMRWRGPIERG